MASRGLQIRDALVAALTGEGKPEGATVEAAREIPYDADAIGPVGALAVYFEKDPVSQGPGFTTSTRGAPKSTHKRRIVVEIRVVDDDAGADIDAKLDVLQVWAVRAVMRDRRVGGLATNVLHVGTEWAGAVVGEHVYGGVVEVFDVEYVTQADDPELP